MKLGLQEPGATCDECRWKIEKGECPWNFDYDENNPYAEDCIDFRSIRHSESRFKDEEEWKVTANIPDWGKGKRRYQDDYGRLTKEGIALFFGDSKEKENDNEDH